MSRIRIAARRGLPSVVFATLLSSLVVASIAGCTTASRAGAFAADGGVASPAAASPSVAAAAPLASVPPELAGFAVDGAPEAGTLPLTDADGRPFDLAALRGAPVVVFFGYTHCPDVCPATTGTLVEVSRTAPSMHAVFVTVDPERDTVAALHEYVSHLPSTFTALTGPSSAIRAAADRYGVRYARVDTGSGNGYTMAHTADTYLVDGAGRLRYRFPFGTPAATYLAAIASIGG